MKLLSNKKLHVVILVFTVASLALMRVRKHSKGKTEDTYPEVEDEGNWEDPDLEDLDSEQ